MNRGFIGNSRSTSKVEVDRGRANFQPNPLTENYAIFILFLHGYYFYIVKNIFNVYIVEPPLEVEIKSSYTLPSPDPTLWDYAKYFVVLENIFMKYLQIVSKNLKHTYNKPKNKLQIKIFYRTRTKLSK